MSRFSLLAAAAVLLLVAVPNAHAVPIATPTETETATPIQRVHADARRDVPQWTPNVAPTPTLRETLEAAVVLVKAGAILPPPPLADNQHGWNLPPAPPAATSTPTEAETATRTQTFTPSTTPSATPSSTDTGTALSLISVVATPSPTLTPTPTATRVPPTSTPTTAATATATTPPGTTLNSVERILATRGDHMLPHEIRLAEPMYSTYSWGQHGTEDTQSIFGSHSVNLWLGVSRDVSQLDTSLGVKVNIRNIRGYVYKASTGTWVQIASGLPTWWVTFDNLPPFNYYDAAPTYEADGSVSFDVPPGRGLHMSTYAPGLGISESNGVVSIVEARLLGTPAAIAAAKLGMGAGADFRDAAGSGGSIQQSGAGQLGLLTGNWKAFDMLSSTLTDDQVRLNPPPLQ